MIQTYNEFKVIHNDNGDIIDKQLTERGTVRISEFTADVNNEYTHATKLLYELKENNGADIKKTDKEHRKELLEMAKELGIDVPKNIKTEALEAKLNQ